MRTLADKGSEIAKNIIKHHGSNDQLPNNVMRDLSSLYSKIKIYNYSGY
jgi:hypothetical protein